jgi:uncharacterized protein YycO
MELADIILVRGTGPISKTIRYVTHSPYSHAAIYVGGGVVEADWYGVQFSNIDYKYKDKAFDVFRLRKSYYTERKKIVDYAMSQMGKKYDYLGLYGILRSYIKHKDDNPYDSKDHYWCSELVADAYLKGGYHLSKDKETHLISPGDIGLCGLLYRVKPIWP